jgi:hypothetical protein
MSSGAELSSAIAKALGLPSPEVSPAFEVTSSPERRPAPDFDNVRTRSNKAIADTDSIIADAMMMSPLVRPGGGGSGKGASTPTRADQAFWARRLTLHDGGAEGPPPSALKVHHTATRAAVSRAGGGRLRGGHRARWRRNVVDPRLSACFALWRREAYAAASIHRYILRSRAVSRKHASLRQAVRRWAEDTASARRRTVLTGRALRRLMHRQGAVALDAWRDRVAEHARLRLVLRRAVTKLMNGRMSMALQGWLRQAAKRRQQFATARRVLLRMNNVQLSQAVAGWRTNAAEQARLQLLLRRSVAKMAHRTLSMVLQGWERWADHRRRWAGQARRVIMRMGHVRQAAAVCTWQAAVWTSRKKAETGRRSILRMQRLGLSQAFAGWQLHATEQAQLRRLLCSCCAKLVHRRLAMALQGWLQRAGVRRRAISSAERALRRMRKLQLGGSFAGWLAAHAHVRACRHRVRVCLVRLLSRLCASAFDGWLWRVEGESKRIVVESPWSQFTKRMPAVLTPTATR